MSSLVLTKDRVMSAFVNQMIKDKGLDGLRQPEKTKLRAKLLSELSTQIEMAFLRSMSDEDLVQLNEMLDNGASDEEINTLLDAAITDYEGVAAKTMKAFRVGFLKGAA